MVSNIAHGSNYRKIAVYIETRLRDFPGGPVVKNPPSNAGDAGSIPGRATKLPHAEGQLSPRALEPSRHN